jgi:hypothetical protein
LILTVAGEAGCSVIFQWNSRDLFIRFGTSIKRSTLAPDVHWLIFSPSFTPQS